MEEKRGGGMKVRVTGREVEEEEEEGQEKNRERNQNEMMCIREES
jgi:hypothetical protein